jgi:hypothetical protein
MDIADILGDRPVAYHPILAKMLGSVNAALFLSQLLYWHNVMKKAAARDKKEWDGWFYKSRDEMFDETGLSRTEQETARKVLGTNGVVKERRKGVPATMHYFIDTKRLHEVVTSWHESDQPVGRKSANQLAGNQQTGRQEIDQQDGKNPADLKHDTTHKTPVEITHDTTTTLDAHSENGPCNLTNKK